MILAQHQEIRANTPEGSQPLKCCTKCGENKPATRQFFLFEKRYGGTLTAHCRVCDRASSRAWQQKNKESLSAARKADLEGKARAAAAKREKLATDPEAREKNRVKSLEYAAKNREAARVRARQWARDNKERLYQNLAIRQARLAAAGPGYTDADVLEKLRVQGYRCTYCGEPLHTKGKGKKFHVDHMTPIARGGRNDPANICCTCPRCNRSKHDRLPEEFLADLKAGRA